MRRERQNVTVPGFTLIELLVVVAIIALLISILLPSLSRARGVARMVKCQAILKQLGTAHQMYANEFEDKFQPVNFGGFGAWYRWMHWRAMLSMTPGDNYPEGLVCPDIPPGMRPVGHPFLNYGMNLETSNTQPPDGLRHHQELNMRWFGGDRLPTLFNTGTGTLMRIYRSRVKQPSNKLQNIDASNPLVSMIGSNWQTRWDLFPEAHPGLGFPGTGAQSSYRHDQGANILMLDGHVEYRPKAATFQYNANNSVNTARNQDLWWVYK